MGLLYQCILTAIVGLPKSKKVVELCAQKLQVLIESPNQNRMIFSVWFVCLSVSLSVCLLVGWFVCLSVCLSVCLFVCLSVCFLSLCLPSSEVPGSAGAVQAGYCDAQHHLLLPVSDGPAWMVLCFTLFLLVVVVVVVAAVVVVVVVVAVVAVALSPHP
jgi:hypothetical protein